MAKPIEIEIQHTLSQILYNRRLLDAGSDSDSEQGDASGVQVAQPEKHRPLQMALRRNIDPRLLELLSKVMHNDPAAKQSLLKLLKLEPKLSVEMKMAISSLALAANRGNQGAQAVLVNCLHAAPATQRAEILKTIKGACVKAGNFKALRLWQAHDDEKQEKGNVNSGRFCKAAATPSQTSR